MPLAASSTTVSPAAVDDVGVVAEAAGHGVVAGAAVEHVVVALAVEHVVAAAAVQGVGAGAAVEGVDGVGAVHLVGEAVAGAGEGGVGEVGQLLDIVGQSVAGEVADPHLVVAAAAGHLDDDVAGIVDIIDVAAGAADHRVGAEGRRRRCWREPLPRSTSSSLLPVRFSIPVRVSSAAAPPWTQGGEVDA